MVNTCNVIRYTECNTFFILYFIVGGSDQFTYKSRLERLAVALALVWCCFTVVYYDSI